MTTKPTKARGLYVTRLFLRILIHPSSTIHDIVDLRPSYYHIAIFIAFIGLLRGLLEEILQVLTSGQSQNVFASTGSTLQFLVITGGPFLISNIATAYVRWAAWAFLAYIAGCLVGGRGRFDPFLRVYGIVLGLYVLTILPNYIYLLADLPVIRFQVSPVYNPTIGIGQVLTSLWLAYISYKCVRIIHLLPMGESILVGLLIPVTNLGILVLGALVFFNLPIFYSISPSKIFLISILLFTGITVIATPLFIWIGQKQDSISPLKRLR